jgi:hypothetical protein
VTLVKMMKNSIRNSNFPFEVISYPHSLIT